MVIDCCPLINVLSLNAVFACDLLLVPVSADYLSLQGACAVDRALDAPVPVFKQRLPRAAPSVPGSTIQYGLRIPPVRRHNADQVKIS